MRAHGDTTVSAVLRTHNASATIERFVQSVLAQKQAPHEIVVVDDGSTDGTVERLENGPLALRVVRNATEEGRAASYSKAIAACTGDVICLCEQDDIWAPRKVLTTSKAFDVEPDLGIAFDNSWVLDGAGRPTTRHLWDVLGLTPDMMRAAIVIGGGHIPVNNPLVRTYAMGRLIPYLVTAYLARGNRIAFRSHLRDVAVPIPTDDVEAWISLIATLLHRYRVLTEPLVTSRPPAAATADPGGATSSRRDAIVRGLATAGVERRRAARRHEAELYHAVADRIDNAAATYPKHQSEAAAAAAAELRAQGAHFTARGTLPASRLRRLPVVARELRGGGYTRYGTGRAGALQDLLV